MPPSSSSAEEATAPRTGAALDADVLALACRRRRSSKAGDGGGNAGGGGRQRPENGCEAHSPCAHHCDGRDRTGQGARSGMISI